MARHGSNKNGNNMNKQSLSFMLQGLARLGGAGCGSAWLGLVRSGRAWCGEALLGKAWCGMAWLII